MLPCGPGSPCGAYLYQQRPLGIAGRRVAHPAPRCIPADVAGPIRIVHRIIAEVVDARDKVTLPQEPLRPGGPGGTLQALRTDVTLRPLRPLCPGESHITLGPLGTHRPDVTLRAWQPLRPHCAHWPLGALRTYGTRGPGVALGPLWPLRPGRAGIASVTFVALLALHALWPGGPDRPCGPGGAYLYQQRPLGIAGRRVAHPAPRCIPADVAGPIRIVHRIIAEVVDARDKVTLPQEPLRPGGPGGTLQALRPDVTLRPLRPLCPGESHITLG